MVLGATTGSGNRPSTGIDDFTLTYTPAGPALPTLTANPTSLTGANGLTYVQGGGPATAPVSVSGTNFTVASGNVTATSSNPAQFTVSPASVPYSGSALPATNFTVGLVEGLAVGSTYSADITFAGGGATTVVPVSGTVTATTPLPNLIINDVTLAEGNSGTTIASFTVTLSAPAPAGGVTFDIATADNTATAAGSDYVAKSLTGQTIPAGSTTYVFDVLVNGDVTSETNETFFVNVTNVTNAIVTDGQGLGTITNDDATPATLISTIQGTGAAATAGTFTIEGIVVGVFPNLNPAGFYVQEEDTQTDGNALSSEGIFVISPATVNVGDQVRITGTVQENSATPSFNQAVITPSGSVSVIGSNSLSLVTPTTVMLPTAALGDLERYEGMLVNFTQALTVTETFNLGQFGEVVLANGRLFNPTNFVDPNDNPATGTNSSGTSNVAAVTAQQNLNDRSRIILDDGSSVGNPTTVPYIDPATKTLRIGSTLTNLTGVLGFAFSAYRIQPTVAPAFSYAPRPAVPTVGGNIKVSAFNVLNYFNGNGTGGGFPTTRGADTPVEFARQRDKIISALTQLNADVVGLIEIENDGDDANSAIADLVSGLNTATAPGTYTVVSLANTTGSSGTDEIKVAFIYKPGAVTPVGNAVYSNDVAFNTARPPLAQTFRSNANGGIFTPIVNHFKSKGSSSGLPGDADQGDGQGLSNATRKAQATALLSFVSQIQTSSGDNDVMILGDLNAYNEEDPIDILRAGGFTKLDTPTESYVFAGQTGSLDHALVTSGLLGQVSGRAYWNINADEPTALDYNDNVQTSGEANSELRNDVTLYAPNAFRSSDHDPVLVGLSLTPSLSATLVASTSVCAGSPASFSLTVAGLSTGATYSYTITNGTNSTTASGVSASAIQTSLIPTVAGSFTATVFTSTNASATAASGNVTINALPTNASLTSGTLTCSATSVTLTASATGGTSYTLSDGQTNMTGVFVVSTAGNYTAIIANASGCTATATATVVSNTAAPTNASLTSGTLTCTTTSVTLMASATGGSSYTLNGGTGPQTNMTGVFVVSTAGNYTAIIANASGCTAVATATVVSNTAAPTATLTASTNPVCAPASVTITAGGTGTSYTFSAGATQIGMTNQAIVTQSGTYSVTVSNASGCTATASVSVTVNTPPAAPTLTGVSRTVTQSNTPLPLGQFVSATGTLSFSSVNGLLNPPNANISQVGIQSFSVTQTDANGCVSAATPFTITVQPSTPTTPGSQTACRSSVVVLNAITTGVRYEWYKNGQSAPFRMTEIASIQKGTATSSLTLVSIQTTANYYVKVFQANGSFTFDGPFLVTVNYGCVASGARVASAEVVEVPLSITLTPNPIVDGQLRAVVRGAAGQALSVELLDLRGSIVRSHNWSMAESEQQIDWNIATQSTGLYLLRVQTADQLKTVKVLKP